MRSWTLLQDQDWMVKIGEPLLANGYEFALTIERFDESGCQGDPER